MYTLTGPSSSACGNDLKGPNASAQCMKIMFKPYAAAYEFGASHGAPCCQRSVAPSLLNMRAPNLLHEVHSVPLQSWRIGQWALRALPDRCGLKHHVSAVDHVLKCTIP